MFFTIFGWQALHGQTATVTGLVLDDNLNPLPGVHVRSETSGTITDKDGFYVLDVIADIAQTLTFSHLGNEQVKLQGILLRTNETFQFSPVLKPGVLQIDGVEITAGGRRITNAIRTVNPELARNIPGANAGVENVLKLLPGVTSNNELSTQYGVRGGNYDENLVYINGIEVYRPFLVRSGQQEGHGIVNSNMVQQLRFSPGGFQASYGDKLSSVLDITYKQPSGHSLDLEASLLGAGATVATVSENHVFSSISGIRYRDNSLFVNSQQTRTNVNPLFADLQSLLQFKPNGVFHLNFLGILSQNQYKNRPLNRQTNFGTLFEPKSLVVYYQGEENNSFSNAMAALQTEIFPVAGMQLLNTAAIHWGAEEEFSNVVAQYELGDNDPVPGDDLSGEGPVLREIGSQYNRSRNILDVMIADFTHKGRFEWDAKNLQWGLSYRREDIRDQIREVEYIDSAGIFIQPPGSPPGSGSGFPPGLVFPVYQGVAASNSTETSRYSAFLQYSWLRAGDKADLYFNTGVRAQYWQLGGDGFSDKGQTIISPRIQFALKPKGAKDMLFRAATGLYQQPPLYRELRDSTGGIRTEVKAQRSYHMVLGHEYSFRMWDRPFHMVSEAYYKYLDRVNPYTLEDVRIRYAAHNEAKAYAAGLDFRLHGAFVPGLESWVSLGYLQTKENIMDRGYIPRPTDQRFKAAILFQDYIPSMPQVRMYLNLIYQTGVPGGSPAYADPYNFQNRLRDYRRADLGISHIFVDNKKKFPEDHWLHPLKEFYAGIEIFNLFNNQNSITNTWVRDAENKQEYAVPNFMTSRVLNFKVRIRI